MNSKESTIKKLVLKVSAIFIFLSTLLLILGYFYFVKIPTKNTQIIVTKFEIAIRKNDIKSLKQLVTLKKPFVKEILLPHLELYKNEFSKFYEGIEIYSCAFYPENISNINKGNIVAYGKMKAKIDNRQRNYFKIFLEQENNEWKISQFAFPDFIDY
ncbi:MAG: hypothetical protein ACNI25_09200 [Halarcobacter sp.]